ncbi:MAG TPA: 2-oxoglutarate dehydrogenase complex dihydrolipoyllysine-residue succinyltransferase [Pirellulales bacterium]|jgi:2-oxoglutarate dehydrogenase E2 component (dihydrolipoamide succinyltransferase)|nr:2-oxoglutarate dehydrogenase complex dihydrolipoyllysine-residue succinyltransferase [Pirellulales bacterium]
MPVELKVPEVGESITEVQIGKWHKGVGDRVEKDEGVVELESDKATVDLPAPIAGTIAKMLKQAGQTAAVGEIIGYLSAPDEATSSKETPAVGAPSSAKPNPSAPEATVAVEKKPGGQTAIGPVQPAAAAPSPAAAERPEPAPSPPADGKKPFVMPAAERALAEHGLAAADVRATGPGGRLLKEDVERHVEQAAAAAEVASPAEPAPRQAVRTKASVAAPPKSMAAERIEYPLAPRIAARGGREEEFVVMSPIRRRIAERLVEAQQAAALLTTFNEIDMSEVMALRQKHKQAYQERYGVKLGFMSFFVKASVDALKLVPQVNAEVREPHVVYHHYYDIGIAVGGGKGLVVPVLRNAEQMSFGEIELAIADFGRRAGANKLKLEELQGGTFTISNGGVYGSLLSTPIVNPPQSGILGLHAIQDRPVARDGQVVIRPMMYVALTYDHRIVDGREAVTFLKRIKETIEDPARMFLEV